MQHLKQSLISSYRQAEDYFWRTLSSRYLSLGDEGTAYMTGVPMSGLNCVYVRKNICAVEQMLTTVRAFYSEEKLPFTILIPEAYCSQTREDELQALGCPQIGQSVAMAIELANDETVDFKEAVLIQPVDGNLKEWIRPLTTAFNATFENATHYVAVHEKAHAQFYHFLYKDEQPVTSLTLSVHENLAGINDVGTLPEHQGKGYATRLMHHALRQAKQKGAQYCFLEASSQGLAFYEKIGFRPLYTNKIFELRREHRQQ